MNLPELGLIALTPHGWTGYESYPGIAVAGARAGAIGVLDLTYLDRAELAEKALEALIQSGGDVGIRCGAEQLEQFAGLLRQLAESRCAKKLVMLCSLNGSYEKTAVQKSLSLIRKLKLSSMVEVVCLEEGRLAQESGADALLARGNECAGRVGEESSFVLLQRLKKDLLLPVWVQGGIGVHSAAAILAAGCAGAVLDNQLLLCRESPLSLEQKEKLACFDGSETEIVSTEAGQFRLYLKPQQDEQFKSLLNAAKEGSGKKKAQSQGEKFLHKELRELLKSEAAKAKSQLPALCELGQDLAFAALFSRKYLSVASVIEALRTSSTRNLLAASQQGTLLESSPFAQSHAIKYPIFQGAMTRVSDTHEFAFNVAEGGGLPFLALSLMRKSEIEPLLKKCRESMQGMAWGVGMLGFVPPELRQEQLKLVLEHKPPCALIAGGRPDQAKELEAAGIKTYLHVPSPALLASFLEMGARRFIFEGRECGGHVGPRSSFLLWDSMIETVLSKMPAKCDPQEIHVVFAGGIHDGLSAAMVAAIAAPLVERGVKIGILMGTAYLFTKEAVASGAIVKKFQDAALECKETVLLETGPGHAIRCLNSPYKDAFDQKRKKLESDGAGKNEVRQELELMNLGRLRVASKGLARGNAVDGHGSKLVNVPAEKQWADGMYMVGQVAALHDKTTSIDDLHKQVSAGADSYLKSLCPEQKYVPASSFKKNEEPIAIVGMSCLFPKASDSESYWQNIINKVNTIEEIPQEQWDWRQLYSEDPLARDKVYSKWGGFISDIPFDPSNYGIPPASLASVDPMQLLILEVTRAALEDAGYSKKSFAKDRTSIVLANAGHGPITAFYSLRSMLDWTLSDMDPAYRKELESRLPEWTEDSFPGYLGNVVAGRVANRFDLGGINFCVDAACASSLAALYIGVRELRAGSSDMVLLAATDTHNQPGDYLSFSKTHALSPRGRCRTFDESADGIVISEGIAVLVLKRLSDAQRAGDRIYALVRGIGGSSDGRDLSLTAPRPAGQMLALERAYEDAGLSPASVELLEAHGTGTVAGDRAEVEALTRVFEKYGSEKRVCALGSVKTMIGHTKCAAGLASVIKVAKSLYHKVLPPTIGVERPNPACNFESSPFYLNTQTRPWLHNTETLGYPRRAGVSAFGFGGTNFHTVLEEYTGHEEPRQDSVISEFPSELFSFKAASRSALERQIDYLSISCQKMIKEQEKARGPLPSNETNSLLELSYRHYLAQANAPSALNRDESHFLLAIVATSGADLLSKLALARDAVKDTEKLVLRDPRGIFFEERKNSSKKKVAFLFPGQGSQQLNMLLDLSLAFSSVRKTFEDADQALASKFEEKLSDYVYPLSVFSDEERQKQKLRLTDTHVAQPAIAAADIAALTLLRSFGLDADLYAGHSFGEYVALAAAGVISTKELFVISERRGEVLKSANGKKSGGMIAVSSGADAVKKLISQIPGLVIANRNSPRQCIVSGETASLEECLRVLAANKISAKEIAVSAAFHSPLMKPAVKELSRALADLQLRKPQLPVYSNTSCKPYPEKPAEIASLLLEHLVEAVDFQKEIEEIYDAGARIFIECGPSAVLTGLVSDILQNKEHLALSLDRHGKHGITQLQFLLAQAFVSGLEPELGKLYMHRIESVLPEKTDTTESSRPRLTYLINGAHVKRFDGSKVIPANRPAEESLRKLSAGSGQTFSSPGIQKPLSEKNASASMTAKPALNQGANLASNSASANSASANNPARAPKVASSLPLPNSDLSRLSGPVARNGRAQVMLEFQRNMLEMSNAFLQSQEKVMLGYLQQQASAGKQLTPNRDALANTTEPAASLELKPAQPESLAELSKSGNGNGNGHDASELAKQITSRIQMPQSGAKPEPPEELNNCSFVEPEKLIAQLIEIVAERTGYPAEMLDPDLDLEADLGIDSIKRVEILNSFRKLLPLDIQNELENGIEKLAGTKTLQGIMDWIRSDLGLMQHGSAPQVAGPQVSALNSRTGQSRSSGASESEKNSAIGRALVRVKELPALANAEKKLSGLYLLSDAENGLSESLLLKLKASGAEALILKHDKKSGQSKGFDLAKEKIELDLTSEETVQNLIQELSATGKKVSGFVHLLPLNKEFLKCEGTNKDPYLMSRSFFVLSKEILGGFAAANKDFVLVSASSIDGNFACDRMQQPDSDFNPLQAALSGMVKSIAREYPQAIARCIDFSMKLSESQIVSYLTAELSNNDRSLVEVGYSKKRRVTPEAFLAPLAAASADPGLELDSSSLVLVTGGARGITAELALELAERHKPQFVLIGRGQRPLAAEDAAYQGLNTARELKAAIIEKERAEGKTINIRTIESIYQALMREREIRNNIARLEKAGSRVFYYSLDVRDEQALSDLIDRIYESFGKIDAVIHGAGVIEDAFLKDKPLASFDRVFGTKIDSALALTRRLQLDSLKYLIFFSSVVGRTGNAGQIDYVAANEVLNKLALRLQNFSQARVLSIGWGPWRGGMASDDLESVFARFGWSMIESEDGRDAFYTELKHGKTTDAEVLLVGQLPGKTGAHNSGNESSEHNGHELSESGNGGNNGNGADAESVIANRGVRMNRAEVLKKEAGSIQLRLRIDPEFDLYLQDHTFNGLPVLPMAVAAELMAEAALFMHPECSLLELQNLDIPQGIIFDSGARDLYLHLDELSSDSDAKLKVQIGLLANPKAARKNFVCTAVLAPQASKLSHKPHDYFGLKYKKRQFKEAETRQPGVDFIYDNWLFHGPLFQGIELVESIGQNGISGNLKACAIEKCLKESGKDSWLLDPMLLDSAMQLAGVWARHYMDITVLPTGFQSLKVFRSPKESNYIAEVRIPDESKNGQLLCDLAIYSKKGELLILMEGLGGSGSKSLNRLAVRQKNN